MQPEPPAKPIGSENHLPPGTGSLTSYMGELAALGTLPSAWAGLWGADPGAKSVHFFDRGWVTAGELDDRSRSVALKLLALDLPLQARVLWQASRTFDSVAVAVGVLRGGFVLVPVDAGVTDRELVHVATDVRPEVAVLDDASLGATISSSAPEIRVFRMDLSELPVPGGSSSSSRIIDAAAADDPALIGFTSGTTGAPKGAVLTHANMLANAHALRVAWRWMPEDRLVHALPLYHGHGLCAALFGTFLAGATVVMLPAFDADEVLDEQKRHEATLFFGVPTMYHRLLGSGRASELGRLRLSVSGSAALAADLNQKIEAESHAKILERYGMTETLLTVSNPYDGDRRAGTIGFPLPGTEAMLDSEGELLVRGPTVFDGYFDKPAQTAERFTSDGWFRTGDIGTVVDGYVKLLGRSTEVVITGGHNVYPAEVEEVLLKFPGVAEVAVSGTSSDEWGEVVTAWVVPASEKLDESALLAHAALGLSNYKRPRIVHQVDSLPRNTMGKVMRRSLGNV